MRAALRVTKDAGRTVGDAADAYERHLEAEGKKQRAETMRRIRSFFADVLDLEIRALAPTRCQKLYEAVRTRKATRWVGSGERRQLVQLDKPVSVNTHQGMLTHSKTFLAWCRAEKWIRDNPLADVEGKGKKKKGKPQLRIDEARRWWATAIQIGEREPGALAALTALLLGLRASEVTLRQVRDLDDEGRLLWIPDSKTEAGRRVVEVPDALRPPLLAIAAGRAGDAILFGGYERDGQLVPHLRGWLLFWTKKICKAAGVPKVSAHSLRGLHATLALQAGATSHLVQAQLGHASDAITLGSYAAPGAHAAGKQKTALGVLKGGKP